MADFNTTQYWSESQSQFISIDSMPLPYCLNAFRKLLAKHSNEFAGTTLCDTFMRRLRPSRSILKSILAARGEASYLMSDREVKAARSMFYKIGKQLGVKVTTEIKGEFMVATCEPVGEEVKVNRVHN